MFLHNKDFSIPQFLIEHEGSFFRVIWEQHIYKVLISPCNEFGLVNDYKIYSSIHLPNIESFDLVIEDFLKSNDKYIDAILKLDSAHT